jgi:hypothetical protein
VKSLPTKLSCDSDAAMRRTPAERRQVEKTLVVGGGLLDDEEAGALDVVGVGEPDQRSIRRHRPAGAAAERGDRQRALTRPSLAVKQAHAHRRPHVLAGVAVLDLTGQPGAANFGRAGRHLRCGKKLVPGPDIQEER